MADADKYMIATITQRQDHAEDLFTIRVQPEQALAFKPGQYVAFGVEDRVLRALAERFVGERLDHFQVLPTVRAAVLVGGHGNLGR